MKKIAFFLAIFLVFLSSAWAARPVGAGPELKSDMEVVDRYLFPFNALEEMQMEREILVRGPSAGVVNALCQAAQTPQTRGALVKALEMLVKLGAPQAVALSMQILTTEENNYRALETSVHSLGALGGLLAGKPLYHFYKKIIDGKIAVKPQRLKLETLEALGTCKAVKYKKILLEEAAAVTGVDQIACYRGLAKMGDPTIHQKVRDILDQTQDPEVVCAAVSLLGWFSDPADLPLLEKLQTKPAADKCTQPIETARSRYQFLGLPEAQRVEKLAAAFQSDDSSETIQAIRELGDMGTPAALAVLVLHLNDPGLGIELEVLSALRKNGKTFIRQKKGYSDVLKIR